MKQYFALFLVLVLAVAVVPQAAAHGKPDPKPDPKPEPKPEPPKPEPPKPEPPKIAPPAVERGHELSVAWFVVRVQWPTDPVYGPFMTSDLPEEVMGVGKRSCRDFERSAPAIYRCVALRW